MVLPPGRYKRFLDRARDLPRVVSHHIRRNASVHSLSGKRAAAEESTLGHEPENMLQDLLHMRPLQNAQGSGDRLRGGQSTRFDLRTQAVACTEALRERYGRHLCQPWEAPAHLGGLAPIAVGNKEGDGRAFDVVLS